jgi:deoxyribonuclease IV
MPLFGAHMSVAGGLHNALLDAQRHGCETVQLFSKNASQWNAPDLSDEQVKLFRRTLAETRLRLPIVHDSYLINLATPDEANYRRSIEAFVVEMERAERIGASYLVMHPGAHLGSGEEMGLRRVAAALDEVHGRCPGYRLMVLLETTAGQGTTLGHRFEHLAGILERVSAPKRLGVCLDTCHVFAAGYSLASETDYHATFRAFERLIGLSKLKAFHLNDSRKPLGSRVDRHEHIGRGCMGLEPFRLLVNDKRFRNRPMVLETAKEEGDSDDMDTINLATLRGLIVPD